MKERDASVSAIREEFYPRPISMMALGLPLAMLLDIGDWKDAEVDARIVEEGQQLDSVLLIFEGEADVSVNGECVATLEDGALIGEMSFLTGETPNASVSTTKDTRYIAWPVEPLREFLKHNPDLRAAWQLIIGTDLASKLKAA